MKGNMSYSLNSLKGGYIGDYMGDIKGDTRSLDYGSYDGGLWGDTLPETNMETQKGPYKDYSPSKRVLYRFPC